MGAGGHLRGRLCAPWKLVLSIVLVGLGLALGEEGSPWRDLVPAAASEPWPLGRARVWSLPWTLS